jgi:hypothetical protein
MCVCWNAILLLRVFDGLLQLLLVVSVLVGRQGHYIFFYQIPVILRLASLLTQKIVACLGLLEANEVSQKWEQKPLRSQKSILIALCHLPL